MLSPHLCFLNSLLLNAVILLPGAGALQIHLHGLAAGAWWQQGTGFSQDLIPTFAVSSDLSPGSPPGVWLRAAWPPASWFLASQECPGLAGRAAPVPADGSGRPSPAPEFPGSAGEGAGKGTGPLSSQPPTLVHSNGPWGVYA